MKDDFQDLLPLTPTELHILLALAAGERHGYAIMQEISKHTGGRLRVGPGSLYGTIKRLLSNGLIVETEERPDRSLNDERRRYYRMNQRGRKVLATEVEHLADVVALARARRLLPAPGLLQLEETDHVETAFLLRVRISGRLYRLLLRAYPAEFRRHYGEPMAQLFRDCCASEFAAAGYLGLVCFWSAHLARPDRDRAPPVAGQGPAPVPGHSSLTPRALRSLEIARQEVERAGHGEPGPGHVLLGLIGEGTGNRLGKETGVAGWVLRALSVDADRARDAFLLQPQPAAGLPGVRGDSIPALLRRAEAEAQRLGHSFVGTEHLLLALIREKNPGTEAFLNLLGVSVDQIEHDTLDVIAS